MKVRKFMPEDYNDVYSWWTYYKDWTPMPLEMLGDNGFIVEKNGQKLAAVWGYNTGCPIHIMEWLVGNPEASWEERSEAINLVTDTCSQWCKQNGAKLVFTMTKNKRLIEKLQEQKFVKSDENMTHLLRSV